ncbi:hypothetical protein AYL99_06748 [Fonsecaea erecta]|uniref:RBR-type E3 ubiquitin transferase n=1 Tax=Fonsecaea erecta TaxID=1367422 RepID=A0A178ZI36_9EURO|nr:hypothetical protein AYL99_06748 [Fonsecaea erecta]OAP59450.1 hypothetical protein AYL99_06748 [Fonsecaea erecta]
MTTLANISSTIDADGDQEMAEVSTTTTPFHSWRVRCAPSLPDDERRTLEAHITSMEGRSFLDEKLWTKQVVIPCSQQRLAPITPGNPYFFHEQVTAAGASLPAPRREALPSLHTLSYEWDTGEAEGFVDQRRRDNAAPSPPPDPQEYSQEGRRHAHIPIDYPVPIPQAPPLAPPNECTVCFEEHQPGELVILHHCHCAYCLPCLNQAFRVACKDRASFPPRCHNVPLRISALGSVLDDDVVERYKEIEAEFGAHRPFYCAAPECSAFIPENNHCSHQGVAVCPRCHHTTCTTCKRLESDHPAWDTDAKKRECPAEEEDVVKLFELGVEEEWSQCPTCGNMVEKTEGCKHMDCVCGVEFCYVCGTLFDENSRCGCHDEEDEEDEEEEEEEEEGEHEEEDEWDLDGFLADDRWPGPAAAFGPVGSSLCLHVATVALIPGVASCQTCSRPTGMVRCSSCTAHLCMGCINRWYDIVRRAFYEEWRAPTSLPRYFRGDSSSSRASFPGL